MVDPQGRPGLNEPHTLPNTKIVPTKEYGEDYMTVRPPLIYQLLRNYPLVMQHHQNNESYSALSDTKPTSMFCIKVSIRKISKVGSDSEVLTSNFP